MYEQTIGCFFKSILIIDDDHELLCSLRDLLVSEGYTVDTASNGREGMEKQMAKPFDLIITDIVMPEEDGLEVIMEVRSANPDTKVIAISGGGYFPSRDYLLMAKELGANLVLCKPFDSISFLSSVKRILNSIETI
ncbi:MAG TPA: response regulator [Tenuifilaceae bacterium]|nr:response regulator [Tenuifilaceae bacterium]